MELYYHISVGTLLNRWKKCIFTVYLDAMAVQRYFAHVHFHYNIDNAFICNA